MSKYILINLSGGDKPGQTSSITNILAAYDVRILDIGQAVVHETLALAILIEIPPGKEFTPLKKELIVQAHELDLQVKFTPINPEAFDHWVKTQGKHRFIITVLGRVVTAAQLARVSATISNNGLNID